MLALSRIMLMGSSAGVRLLTVAGGTAHCFCAARSGRCWRQPWWGRCVGLACAHIQLAVLSSGCIVAVVLGIFPGTQAQEWWAYIALIFGAACSVLRFSRLA